MGSFWKATKASHTIARPPRKTTGHRNIPADQSRIANAMMSHKGNVTPTPIVASFLVMAHLVLDSITSLYASSWSSARPLAVGPVLLARPPSAAAIKSGYPALHRDDTQRQSSCPSPHARSAAAFRCPRQLPWQSDLSSARLSG